MSEILGHETVLANLRIAAEHERLPHALLFSGPEGVGKRTLAHLFATELVAGTNRDEASRVRRGAHERVVLVADLEKPLPVRRRDLLDGDRDEAALLEAYEYLEAHDWMSGRTPVAGADVIDLIQRNPERFTGRKGIPFADVIEKELAALERARKVPPHTRDVARRLFSPGTSTVLYRRNLGIELINGKGDGAYFRSIDSLLATKAVGWRVAILDDAHRMTDAAENAFLKTLEEPPPDTLIVLVTSQPLSLLPTTLSRCARIVFDAVPAEGLTKFLIDTQGVAPREAKPLVSLAEGSVAKALALRGLNLAERQESLEEVLTAVAADDLASVFAWIGHRLARVDKDAGRDAQRVEARLTLELLALGLRDLVMTASGVNGGTASGLSPRAVSALAARRTVGHWERLFQRTELALTDIDANVEPRLALEALFAEALSATA